METGKFGVQITQSRRVLGGEFVDDLLKFVIKFGLQEIELQTK